MVSAVSKRQKLPSGIGLTACRSRKQAPQILRRGGKRHFAIENMESYKSFI
jgi:hypothetical protein